jgi:hypothetical protein
MRKFFLLAILAVSLEGNAQNDRVSDFNYLNWLQTFNTLSLHKKWSLHLEYQWRRDDGLKHWQQSLLRVGVNYKLHENVAAHVGYGWIETFPYGDYPIASAGTFPEHRIYEQLTLRQPVSKWTFTHRFRIEQRWLGKMKAGTDREIEDWTFLHRFRYQFRSQYPFRTKGDRQLYGVAANEIFIGAGKNLGVNIFDQNRVFLLLGFRLNTKFSVEAGYMNQSLQQGRRLNDRTIMQRNNGWVLGTFLNL